VADPADKLIAAAARAGLEPLGLVRKRRTRSWIDDHGWWLLNVEFQPTSHAVGCYINVGAQHLWAPRTHLCFEQMERPLGGSSFVSFNGDEAEFAASLAGAVATTADAVIRRRSDHGEGRDALQRLSAGADDLHAGIAATLLGDTSSARTRLTGQIHPTDRGIADAYLGLDTDQARVRASADVANGRAMLGLAESRSTHW
jgi:hypothetical protein